MTARTTQLSRHYAHFPLAERYLFRLTLLAPSYFAFKPLSWTWRHFTVTPRPLPASDGSETQSNSA